MQAERAILKLPLLLSAFILIVTTLAVWSRWYYISTRTIICGSAVYAIWYCFQTRHRVWAILLAAIAVLFNPFIRIRLEREPWHAVEFVAALVFVISAFALNPESRIRRLKSRPD
jgi:Family of unknown function (DUF6804)